MFQRIEPTNNKTDWPWTVDTSPDIYDKSFNWPKKSLVTPCFNQAQFIGETILSVINQNYPNLKYIIVDDGSKVLNGYR